MFVDADCLLVKRDIDVYWNMARPFHFGITGARKTSGSWKGADIARLLEQEQSPYLVQMNSGVFCFDDSSEAAVFFEGLNDFYLRRRDALGIALHRGKPAQTDEIYIGLWMGLNGMDSCGGRIGINSWMVSTWRAFWLTLELERGYAMLRKPRRSTAGIPNPLLGWDCISPTLMHFIGLKPQRRYATAAAYFRSRAKAA